jgi:hypothetical protein
MDRDEALRIVVPLDREDRKVLLGVLCSEMNVDDLEEVLNKNGFVTE